MNAIFTWNVIELTCNAIVNAIALTAKWKKCVSWSMSMSHKDKNLSNARQ